MRVPCSPPRWALPQAWLSTGTSRHGLSSAACGCESPAACSFLKAACEHAEPWAPCSPTERSPLRAGPPHHPGFQAPLRCGPHTGTRCPVKPLLSGVLPDGHRPPASCTSWTGRSQPRRLPTAEVASGGTVGQRRQKGLWEGPFQGCSALHPSASLERAAQSPGVELGRTAGEASSARAMVGGVCVALVPKALSCWHRAEPSSCGTRGACRFPRQQCSAGAGGLGGAGASFRNSPGRELLGR